MSNTTKVHNRFWGAMQQRYGIRRWNELYGEDISPTWRELIDKFIPEDLKLALGQLSKEAPDFPPTLPQFEAILSKVARKQIADPTDWVRGYWRSMIVLETSYNLGHTMRTMEPVIIENRNTLGAHMRSILDEMCAMELATGQRTEGMLDACRDKCLAMSRSYQHLRGEEFFRIRIGDPQLQRPEVAKQEPIVSA